MFDIAFAFGATTTALLLAVGHWFPWPRRLHRLGAYTYGVWAILVGTTIWLGRHGRWLELGGMLIIVGIGGLTTGAAYGVDALHNLIQRRKVATDDRQRE